MSLRKNLMTQWLLLFTMSTMIRSLVLMFIVVVVSFSSKAADEQQEYFNQFKSIKIHFPDRESAFFADSPGRYPAVLDFFFNSLLGWTPTGQPKTMSTQCAPEGWARGLRDSRVNSSVKIQGGLIQKYFLECESELTTKNRGDFSNFFKMMSMKYRPAEHPFLRRIVINLPGNVRLKGLLGLKGDYKRRPLVVVRLGIFSSIEDFKPERAWAMMLFEQAPFNVLIVENMTSPDFVANNSQFSFGGYDEGIQNILIAKMLQSSDEPIARIVESVHFFGISLGGHGVLFASLLNKFNSERDTPLIKSFTAMCPVVNLKPTMQSLQEGNSQPIVDLWSRRRLKGLEEKLGESETQGYFNFLSRAIDEVVRTYRGGISFISSIKLPLGMKDSQDFWSMNDFWSYYSDVKEPVLIFATKNDPAVPYDLNSKKIFNRAMQVNPKNIRVVQLDAGVHCTLPIAYDWFSISSLLQSYILSHSSEFNLVRQNLQVELSDEEWKGFLDRNTKVSFEVVPPATKAGFVIIEAQLVNGRDEEKTFKLSLPLSNLDFKFWNAELSRSEKEMIVRWLNQNLILKTDSQGKKHFLQVTWPVAT